MAIYKHNEADVGKWLGPDSLIKSKDDCPPNCPIEEEASKVNVTGEGVGVTKTGFIATMVKSPDIAKETISDPDPSSGSENVPIVNPTPDPSGGGGKSSGSGSGGSVRLKRTSSKSKYLKTGFLHGLFGGGVGKWKR